MRGQGVTQRLDPAFVHQHPVERRALLACGDRGGARQLRGDGLRIRIGKDDGGRLAAEF